MTNGNSFDDFILIHNCFKSSLSSNISGFIRLTIDISFIESFSSAIRFDRNSSISILSEVIDFVDDDDDDDFLKFCCEINKTLLGFAVSSSGMINVDIFRQFFIASNTCCLPSVVLRKSCAIRDVHEYRIKLNTFPCRVLPIKLASNLSISATSFESNSGLSKSISSFELFSNKNFDTSFSH
ncbi:hypothetical protein DERP_012022 [Dermatophagoides pteronyssinus]|uniref:Uncharacterized protein n=1 Tax=Dermatophagoides pteronyssinus TaxID=6956 RepID=A0ABQ8IVQ1_DERPT|nr:hypothetical protein DERP_012022 [Dermatophagoides pteronyssinus]